MKVSIRIPCYNQPHLLDYCLHSIKSQNFENYKIIVIDDCSSTPYNPILKKHSDLKIKYLRNSQNKGAIGNMLYALNIEDSSEYKMVFHEDDIMQPNFIDECVKALEKTNCGFVCTYISFFDHHDNFNTDIIDVNRIININQETELIELIVGGAPIGFGTILYKKEVAQKAFFDLKQFDVMGDRPMFINLLPIQGGAIIPYPLVAAFSHWDKDQRWKTLKYSHAFNLHKYYLSFMGRRMINPNIIGFTHSLIEAFNLVGRTNVFIKLWYYCKAISLNMISLKYILLYNNRIRHFVEITKK